MRRAGRERVQQPKTGTGGDSVSAPYVPAGTKGLHVGELREAGGQSTSSFQAINF